MTSLIEIKNERLGIKLNKDTLTSEEVTEGIQECFAKCQMVFMQQRNPDLSEQEVNQFAEELIHEVYREEGLTVSNATPTMLRHVIGILDARFEFMQDPELRTVHEKVMAMLLEKLESTDASQSS